MHGQLLLYIINVIYKVIKQYINVLANQRDRITELENELLKVKEKNRAKTKRISKLEERLKNINERDNEENN